MKHLFSALVLMIFVSCNSSTEDTTEDSSEKSNYVPLPYIGFHDVDKVIENGVERWDTLYHTVPDFELMDQDSVLITQKDIENRVYVANFFFTSCPAICPAMMEQMKRLQGMTNDIDELVILSHSIDPERDTIPKLRKYIADHEIDTHNWHLLYGEERAYVRMLGEEGYMLNVMDDDSAPGGFLHSEYFALVDRERHIRGLYNGTKTDEVDQLNKDIRKLIENEYN